MSPSPTRITTAEQLAGFENGTVVRDRDGRIWEKEADPSGAGLDWMCMQSTFFREGRYLVLPADLLWPHPAAPPVSDTAAPTITPSQSERARDEIQDYAIRWSTYMDSPSPATRPSLGSAYDAVLAALGPTVTDKADQ